MGKMLRTRPDPRGVAAQPPKPFLFLHIPKTAGTSLLTQFDNAFGPWHVRRLGPAESSAAAVAALLASPDMAAIRCLAGHIPVHAVAERLDGFRAFTLLRHPVDRVMSLFRFLRRQPPEVLARMQLRPDFGFAEFLTGRAPELFGQVRNGMCRMLCGLSAVNEPDHALFWQPRLPGDVVERALATLHGIGFGLAEAMPETLMLLQTTLGLPFDDSSVVENASDPPGAEWTAGNLMRLVELNAGDLALYHEAAALFHARVSALRLAGAGRGTAACPATAMPLRPDTPADLRDLPGRQGFHPYEPELGFAWVVGTGPARIAFAAAPGRARVRLLLFAATATYPVEEIAVTLNGSAVPHRWTPLEGLWGVLETESVPLGALNALALSVPYTLPARLLAPDSRDRRQVSVALATLELAGGVPAA